MATRKRKQAAPRRRDAVAVRAAAALSPASKPKGRAGARRTMVVPRALFVQNENGQPVVDPVSLDRIPVRRAVRVGKQHWNSRTLRELFARDPRATNPLTRQPFPPEIVKRYAPQKHKERIAEAVQVAGMAREILDASARGAQLQTLERLGFSASPSIRGTNYKKNLRHVIVLYQSGPNGTYRLSVSEKGTRRHTQETGEMEIGVFKYDDANRLVFVASYKPEQYGFARLYQKAAPVGGYRFAVVSYAWRDGGIVRIEG